MSGSGLWFSRFTAGSEGWLPLFALGDVAWKGIAGAARGGATGHAPNLAAPSAVARTSQATPPARPA